MYHKKMEWDTYIPKDSQHLTNPEDVPLQIYVETLRANKFSKSSKFTKRPFYDKFGNILPQSFQQKTKEFNSSRIYGS